MAHLRTGAKPPAATRSVHVTTGCGPDRSRDTYACLLRRASVRLARTRRQERDALLSGWANCRLRNDATFGTHPSVASSGRALDDGDFCLRLRSHTIAGENSTRLDRGPQISNPTLCLGLGVRPPRATHRERAGRRRSYPARDAETGAFPSSARCTRRVPPSDARPPRPRVLAMGMRREEGGRPRCRAGDGASGQTTQRGAPPPRGRVLFLVALRARSRTPRRVPRARRTRMRTTRRRCSSSSAG